MTNPEKCHDEHQHSYEEHNNILMVRMFTQIFKQELVGPWHIAKDHWSPSNGYKSPKTL